MTVNPTQPELAPAVRAKLYALRRRIRRYVWLHGLGVAVVWLGIAFWLSLGIDRLLEPPVPVRGAILGAAAAGLAWVLFWWIFRRALVRLSLSNLAMLLERRFPQFDESLLTAVELSGRGGELGVYARRMLAHTCRLAAEPIGRVALREVFNPRPLRRSTLAAALLAASVWAFGALAPTSLEVWSQRNLLLREALWPRKTRLVVEGFVGGVAKVARGDDLEVLAKADLAMPWVPSAVEVRCRTESGARLRGTMSRVGTADPASDAYQEYAYTFRGLLEPIRFDVVGGDDAVRDLRIEVVDSPTLVEMALDCRFPGYMHRPPRTLPVAGMMQIPVGTEITVRAAANKELVRVEIDDGEHLTAIERGEQGEQEERAIAGAAGFRRFAYRLTDFSGDMTFRFTLFDADGIRSRQPVRLALAAVPDQAPELAAELRGIGPAITPKARLPVQGQITDDYGLARVWFSAAVDQAEPKTYPIASPPGNMTDFKLDQALEASAMSLAAGQKLVLCVQAADRCDLAQGPNVGTSQRWPLDVVTPEKLRTMLEARELVLRQRFERIREEVSQTRELLVRMELGLSPQGPDQAGETADQGASGQGGTGEDDPAKNTQQSEHDPALSAERALALRRLRVERAVQNGRKNAQETLGVAEAVESIREELVNNRIDTEELKARLQRGIAEPLRHIGDMMFPELDRRLARLEADLADAQAGPESRRLAVAQIDAILAAIEDVLRRMLELEDFNKAIELLREIIRAQERLSDETRQQHKQQLRALLEE